MKKLIIFLPLYILYLYFNTYKGENIYSKYIYVDGNNVYVNKINNKLLIKKQFEYNNYEIVENGHYTLYYNNDELIYVKPSIFNKYRRIISNRIDKYFTNNIKEISKVLILNEKSNFNKIKYRQLGISHLISISGLHISIMFMILSKIKLKNTIILSILTFYTLVIGHNPPITRAYLMLGLTLLFKNIDIRKSYLISLVLNLLINPYQIISISFIFNLILISIYSIFINLIFIIYLIPNKLLIELVNMYYISLKYIIDYFYYYNIFEIKLNISIIFSLIYYIILIYCIIIFKMLK